MGLSPRLVQLLRLLLKQGRLLFLDIFQLRHLKSRGGYLFRNGTLLEGVRDSANNSTLKLER